MREDDAPSDYAETRLPAVVLERAPNVFETLKARLPRGAGALASVGLFLLAAVLLGHTLANVSFANLGASLAETSGWQIMKALALTALSYLALTGYDVVALRHIGAYAPYRVASLASFASYAISFNLGFPVVTSAAVRYWVYARAELTALQVANVTVFAGVTFWLGMTLMMGVGMIMGAVALSHVDHVPAFLHFLLGVAVVAGVAFYCVWAALERRFVSIRGHVFELPGLAPSLAQIALGVVDICAAAGALYALLPAGVDLDFLPFVAVYVFACLLGVISHAPGGLGVFEATMLAALPGPSHESVLASLLLFRAIYYFLPFIFALAVLGADEGARRWSSLRDAIARIIEERSP
ncbi:MAG: hypothetical protein CTY15_01190 [Methylocystis sp.]|nr:MAG: hypothetical protein CTY15_01190 [Methylocystis sp.]